MNLFLIAAVEGGETIGYLDTATGSILGIDAIDQATAFATKNDARRGMAAMQAMMDDKDFTVVEVERVYRLV